MQSNRSVQQVLDFWFGDPPGQYRQAWFTKDPAFDAQIREQFLTLHEAAAAGRCATWGSDPQARPLDCIALIVVTDQFPRNMFRGEARAFATDPIALEAARRLVASGADRGLLPVQRQFAYLPFEHSESLEDQQRGVELLSALDGLPQMQEPGLWARRHLEIIARFGRFPHRNAALGRTSSEEELAFLQQPGSGF